MKKKKHASQPIEIKPASDRWAWGLVLAILVVAAAVRIRLLSIPLERDEGEFAYMGQLMLQGIPPYKLACNMKLPGIYGVYALIMAVFGQTAAGIHLGLLLVNAAAIVLVFLLVKRLYNGYAGVAACAAFALLSISPSVMGTSAHATHFVILPALGGILLMLKAIDSGHPAKFFWSGLLLGLAFIMKQPGLLFIIFAALYLLWNEVRIRPADLKRSMMRMALLLVGAMIPFGLTCLILRAAGVFDKFWFWTFDYAREYASRVPFSIGSKLFAFQASRVIGPSIWLWVLAGIGFAALILDKKARVNRAFNAGFLIFSFLAVCPGLYFREHYFILMLPAVALLVGVAVGSVRNYLLSVKPALQLIPAIIFVIAVGCSVTKQADFLFRMTPVEACRMMYSLNPFPESLEIAKYIKARTTDQDRILVLGSEPQIYFYADRKSSTSHIYMYGLMEDQRYALQMQNELIREAEASRPKYLVFVNVETSWLAQPNSKKLVFDWFQKYQKSCYDLAGVIDILSPEWTTYYWDDEVSEPQSSVFVYVFRRKPS